MPYDPAVHHRRSIRLKEYDYASAGAYFVTVCVQDRLPILGGVHDAVMQPSVAGLVVQRTWESLPARFANVRLDAFCLMPNHIHGIIILQEAPEEGEGAPRGGRAGGSAVAEEEGAEEEGAPRGAPTDVLPPARTVRRATTLGAVVGAFKSLSAIGVNRTLGREGVPLWQRNYWEHVIRDDADHTRLYEYIVGNPGRWLDDALHPDAPPREPPRRGL